MLKVAERRPGPFRDLENFKFDRSFAIHFYLRPAVNRQPLFPRGGPEELAQTTSLKQQQRYVIPFPFLEHEKSTWYIHSQDLDWYSHSKNKTKLHCSLHRYWTHKQIVFCQYIVNEIINSLHVQIIIIYIYIYIYIYTHTYIHIYIYIYTHLSWPSPLKRYCKWTMSVCDRA